MSASSSDPAGEFDSPTSSDPTGTTTQQDNWEEEFNERWERVIRAINRVLLETDRFSLGPRGATIGDTYRDDAERLTAFREWIRSVIDREIVEPLSNPDAARDGSHWTGAWLLAAYEHGLERGDELLQAASYRAPATSPAAAITNERHKEILRRQYVRLYLDLQDIARETAKRAARTLDDQLDQPTVDPQALAEEIIADVDAEGATRTAAVAAAWPVLMTNRGALKRYEAAGVSEVGAAIETDGGRGEGTLPNVTQQLRGSWLTVLDEKTCEQCEELHGRTWPLSAFLSGEAPLPVKDTHIHCRCMIVPKPTTSQSRSSPVLAS